MSDIEIKKGLETCVEIKCSECLYKDNGCIHRLLIDILDLLNREETGGNKKTQDEAVKELVEIIVADYPEMEYYLNNLVKEFTEGKNR